MVELTEEGKIFARHAQSIYDEYCKLILRMKQLKNDADGKLTIGFLQDLPQNVFTPIIREFRARYKNIALIFHDFSMEKLLDKLRLKEVDIAFGLSNNFLDYQDISSMWLTKLPMYVAVAWNHPLKDCPSLKIEELKNEKFVIVDPTGYMLFHRHILGMCKMAGFEPNICAYASYVPSLLLMAGYGTGIAIVSEAAKSFASDDIIFIPLENEAAYLRTILMWRTLTTNPAVSQFTALCKDKLEPTNL
jgi:DNA-binding transcriptional LysR family regulator